MSRFIAAIVALSVLFMWSEGWAQLSPNQEKRLKELEEKEKAWQAWDADRSDQEKNIRELRVNRNLNGGIIKAKKSDENDNPLISDNKVGKYQAIRMDSNAIFILDTVDGHLWVWVIQKDSSGQSSEFLFYQGQVIPGSEMGDLIDRTYKKIPGNPAPNR